VCGITGLIVTPVVREPRRQRPDAAVHALHLDRNEPRGHAHLTGPPRLTWPACRVRWRGSRR